MDVKFGGKGEGSCPRSSYCIVAVATSPTRICQMFKHKYGWAVNKKGMAAIKY